MPADVGKMHIICTGSKTILLDFFNLKVKSLYNHGNKTGTDFQFFANHEIFAQIANKSDLEFIQVVKVNGNELKLKRAFRQHIQNISWVACPKKTVDELAYGTTDGLVKTWNIEKTEANNVFNAHNRRSPVSFIDYSPTDAFLIFCYKNGGPYLINVKAKLKAEKIIIESATTARFHRTNESLLGVTLNNGGFGIYDRVKKSYIFDCPSVGYCKDVAFCKEMPYLVASVGHYCSIFDTRDNKSETRLTLEYPFTTVAISNCGKYVSAGNMGGELGSLDRRNMKKWIMVNKIDKWDIQRVAFTAPLP